MLGTISILTLVGLLAGIYQDLLNPIIKAMSSMDDELESICLKEQKRERAKEVHIALLDVEKNEFFFGSSDDEVHIDNFKFEPTELIFPFIIDCGLKQGSFDLNSKVLVPKNMTVFGKRITNYRHGSGTEDMTPVEILAEPSHTGIITLAQTYSLLEFYNYMYSMAIIPSTDLKGHGPYYEHLLGYGFTVGSRELLTGYKNLILDGGYQAKTLLSAPVIQGREGHLKSGYFFGAKAATARHKNTGNDFNPKFSSATVICYPINEPKYFAFVYMSDGNVETTYYGAILTRKIIQDLLDLLDEDRS